LSVLFRFTDSDYPFGIVKLLLQIMCFQESNKYPLDVLPHKDF